MESFIFAINAVAPIVILVAIGYFLKKLGWMNVSFAKLANSVRALDFRQVIGSCNVQRDAVIKGMSGGKRCCSDTADFLLNRKEKRAVIDFFVANHFAK